MKRISLRPTTLVGLVALVVGLLVQLWSHQNDLVHAFWDAQAHLDIARRVFDSTTPGLQMLGTVWLPIPHLLYLPFTLVDPWWWSGLAGGLVGLIAYVITVVSLFSIASRRMRLNGAIVAVAALALNPSFLYLQTTAMTEPLLLAFMTGSVAYIDLWWDKPDSKQWLIPAGIFAALAVGSRYDGWFFVAVATPMIWWHSQRLAAAIRFALPASAMGLAWLAYNQVFFGDPLEFQRGIWSAAAQQGALIEQGLLPTAGAPLTALGYYLGAVALTVGWVITLVGVAGLLTRWRKPGSATVVLLTSALVFNLLAMVAGQSVIALPWTDPAGVLNLRYGLMLLPALALGCGFAANYLHQRRGTLLALVVAGVVQIGIWGWEWPTQVGALREGLAIRDGDQAQMRVSRWLGSNYDRGRVLVSPVVNISPRTRIRIRDRVYPWTWQLGDSALKNPAAVVDWVILDRRASSDTVLTRMQASEDFGTRFRLAHSDAGIEIWQRK